MVLTITNTEKKHTITNMHIITGSTRNEVLSVLYFTDSTQSKKNKNV